MELDAKTNLIEEQKKKEVVVAPKKGNVEDWSPEEIASLTKAIVRFPPGTTQRWKVIQEYVGCRT